MTSSRSRSRAGVVAPGSPARRDNVAGVPRDASAASLRGEISRALDAVFSLRGASRDSASSPPRVALHVVPHTSKLSVAPCMWRGGEAGASCSAGRSSPSPRPSDIQRGEGWRAFPASVHVALNANLR